MTPANDVQIPLGERCERHPRDGFALAEPLCVSPASERAVLGLVRALLPPPPAPRSARMDEQIARHVRVMLQYMPVPLRLGFLVLVHLLDWSPLYRFRAFARISRLDPVRGSEVLAAIATSRLLPVRLMLLAPKAIVLSTYFDQDEVHAALDYEPKSFLRERIARRESLLPVLDAEAAGEVGVAP